MTLATLLSRTSQGLDAPLVRVEVDVGAGLPAFSVVGLLETAVKESKDRVRAALANCGYEFPAGRVTVNLAPADLPKEGGRFDLAIAVGILVAVGQPAGRAVRRHASSTASSHSAATCTASAARCRRRCRPSAQDTRSILPQSNATRGGAGARRAHLLRPTPAGRLPITLAGSKPCRSRRRECCRSARGASPTWPKFAASRRRGARSKSRPPANTACC